MLVASDSESDLPIFPHLSCASKHDFHGFLHTFFRMKSFMPEFKVTKLLLDSAHDAMPYYEYCKRAGITPFIDLNGKGGIKLPYKNDFTIGKDGVPVCREGLRMHHDGVNLRNIVLNSGAHLLIEKPDVPARIHVLNPSMEERYI